jgi:hypothetical protein
MAAPRLKSYVFNTSALWFAASRVSSNLNYGFFGCLHVLLTTAFTLLTRSLGHTDTTSHCFARTGSVSCKSATVALDNGSKLLAIGFRLDWSVLSVIRSVSFQMHHSFSARWHSSLGWSLSCNEDSMKLLIWMGSPIKLSVVDATRQCIPIFPWEGSNWIGPLFVIQFRNGATQKCWWGTKWWWTCWDDRWQ